MRPTPARGTRFRLRDRALDPSSGRATFAYELDGVDLVEEVVLPPATDDGAPAESAAVERLLDIAHLAIGTSYFKVSAPAELAIDRPVDPQLLDLAAQLYDDGLREFAVTNGLPVPLDTRIEATVGAAPEPVPPATGEGEPRSPLLPIGGGKDSAAVLGLFPASTAITVTATPAQRRLTAAAGVEHLEVQRTLDPKLAALTASGMNGHIPITAVNAALSTLVAVLRGHDLVAFGNERSADEPTRWVDGVPVNHQHSKSLAYERALAGALAPTGVACCSVLRRLSGLSVAGLVAQDLRLRTEFLSCNKAFKRSREPDAPQTWCLECPKCLSTFLAFAPFLSVAEAEAIFGGNPLADPDRTTGFAELWDAAAKPFECVAELAESAVAMEWLGAAEGWRDLAVVRDLAGGAAAAAGSMRAAMDDLLLPSGPHQMPAALSARVDERAATVRPRR
jgi:hypothetical protein